MEKALTTRVLAFENIKRKPYRTAALITVVALSAAVLFANFIITSSLKGGIKGLKNRLGADLMIVPQGYESQMENVLLSGEPNYFYMDKSIEKARDNGYVETIFHRKRYLPDINSRNATVRGYAERNAINAPIQGSAADIIKVAMAHIYQRFKTYNLKAKMILQVHDELNFSVPTSEKEIVEKIVMEEMEHAYLMRVPLKADCGWGKNWLEAH